jgi:hypothetical protein
MTEPPDLAAASYHWPKEAAPSARDLTAEETRAEMIAQMEKARTGPRPTRSGHRLSRCWTFCAT